MEEESISLFDLDVKIDDASGTYLRDTTKWTRIISIIFIVLAGITFLGFLGFLAMRSTIIDSYTRAGVAYSFASTGEGIFNVIVIVLFLGIAALTGFTVLLLRFSKFTRRGIDANDQFSLETGVASLKTYMIVMGILTFASGLLGLYQFIKLFI